jgi:prepilin-type processing-associated H-X9-DG protein
VRCPEKLSLHKNYSKKTTANILFADGNIEFSKDGYGTGNKKGYALDIAFCNPAILALFADNFDCGTFHELLLSSPVGYTFTFTQDKRIKCFNEVVTEEIEPEQDFVSEVKIMISQETTKLELNSLRLAYGKVFNDLIEILVILERPDLVVMMKK